MSHRSGAEADGYGLRTARALVVAGALAVAAVDRAPGGERGRLDHGGLGCEGLDGEDLRRGRPEASADAGASALDRAGEPAVGRSTDLMRRGRVEDAGCERGGSGVVVKRCSFSAMTTTGRGRAARARTRRWRCDTRESAHVEAGHAIARTIAHAVQSELRRTSTRAPSSSETRRV